MERPDFAVTAVTEGIGNCSPGKAEDWTRFTASRGGLGEGQANSRTACSWSGRKARGGGGGSRRIPLQRINDRGQRKFSRGGNG